MTDIAERNRQIKKLVSKAFAPHKVTVRGHRGTAFGWVSINIDYAPRDWRERQELNAQVCRLLDTAKLEVGTFGYDDPGSDYGYGRKMHVNFAPCREAAS